MPRATPSLTIRSSISWRVCRRTVPCGDLPMQRLRRRKLQLLAGLTPGVVGARNLHAAERSGGQLTAVLAGERRADGVHVVDDPQAFLAQPEAVGLAGPEVSALDGVLDEPQDAVVVDLACPRRVDAALRGDAVRAARAVVVREALDVVAEFTKGGRAAGSRRARCPRRSR